MGALYGCTGYLSVELALIKIAWVLPSLDWILTDNGWKTRLEVNSGGAGDRATNSGTSMRTFSEPGFAPNNWSSLLLLTFLCWLQHSWLEFLIFYLSFVKCRGVVSCFSIIFFSTLPTIASTFFRYLLQIPLLCNIVLRIDNAFKYYPGFYLYLWIIYIYRYLRSKVNIYIYIYAYTHTHMYVCMYTYICIYICVYMCMCIYMVGVSLMAQMVKNLPAMQETQLPSLEKEIATHSNILDQRIPWTEEPGGLQSMAFQWVRQDSLMLPYLRSNNQKWWTWDSNYFDSKDHFFVFFVLFHLVFLKIYHNTRESGCAGS